MGKEFKRVLLALFLIMIVACFGTEKSSLHQIRAEESNTLQGTYGDNLKWKFEDGRLTISGTGVIPKSFIDDLISYESPGFKKHQVKEIRIEQGDNRSW